ncbi:gephyrin-like molybdotransferase receptor GlpR [Nocardia sp. 004]|uniref:divisome protein SepX/GlpR n=1 Tax=Nocardia sp. 004 TaxID=3385978 RepID=UPI0039A2E697
MPNSVLWIGFVVFWIFFLVPILADRHPRIRRITDAALATRVLYRGDGTKRSRKGPAAGHDTDPNWRPRRVPRKYPPSDDAEDRMTTPADEPVTEIDEENPADPIEATASGIADAVPDDPGASGTGRATAAPDDGESEGDIAVAESATKTAAAADDDDVGVYHPEPVAARIPPARSTVPAYAVSEEDYDAYPAEPEFIPTRRGRGGFDPEADAIARAARYTFRQRAVLGLLLTALCCGILAFLLTPILWWAAGFTTVTLVTYLAYLRRQVRMEEEIRRRRTARLARGRQYRGADSYGRRGGHEFDAMDHDTARTLHRRSELVEPDDEDPVFDHLDPFDPAAARALRTRTGRDIRRAAGA